MAILLSDSYKIINWDLNTKALDIKYWGKVTDSGRGCKVALLQNGVLKTPSTETMRVNFKKPSGLQIFLDGVISGNYFVFDFTEQIFAEQGEVMAELMLNIGGEWLMSSTFYIQVDQSFTSAIESSAELTALQTALTDVDEVKSDIVALENPTFTEASTLANIVSGESQATLWGKVKKMFSFIGTTALTTTAQTITTAINELVGINAYTTGTPTYVANLTALLMAINKAGKQKNCSFALSLNANVSANATIFTLPVGFRPAFSEIAVCRIDGNATYQCLYLDVLTNGNVSCPVALSSGNQIFAKLTFV